MIRLITIFASNFNNLKFTQPGYSFISPKINQTKVVTSVKPAMTFGCAFVWPNKGSFCCNVIFLYPLNGSYEKEIVLSASG